MKKANLRLAIAASLGLLVVGGRTEASVLIDISQVGSNVVAVGSGELDLIGLTFDSERAGKVPTDAHCNLQPQIAEHSLKPRSPNRTS